MRKFLALVLLTVLAIGVHTNAVASRLIPFETQVRASTGAIFIGPDRSFDCSGTEVGHTNDGNGVFLTARHCAANPETNKINENIKISFSDNQGGPFYDAVPIAISLTDDVALLLVRNGGSIPEIRIKDNRKLRSGDPIFNVSFPLGTGKGTFHGEYMGPKFSVISELIASQYPMWMFAMPMNLTIAHGSSGSGVFSSKERALIGVAVGTFDEGSYNIAIPSERVLYFLNDLKDNTVEKFVQANPIKDAPDDWF